MSEQSVFDSKTTLLDSIIQPIPDPHYTIDSPFIDLERMLEGYHNNWGLNLEPDFQRGHVWTDAQRISYMEVSALESASFFPKISSSHLKSITSSLDFHYDHSRTC